MKKMIMLIFAGLTILTTLNGCFPNKQQSQETKIADSIYKTLTAQAVPPTEASNPIILTNTPPIILSSTPTVQPSLPESMTPTVTPSLTITLSPTPSVIIFNVITNGTYFYKGPNLLHPVIVPVKKGVALEIISKYNNGYEWWFLAKTKEGVTGWLYEKWLDVDSSMFIRIPDARDVPTPPVPTNTKVPTQKAKPTNNYP